MKYLVVLFKDKNRKKIINKFKTFERAKNFFDRKISENKVTFNKLIENGKSCSFELGILEKGSNNFDLYRRSFCCFNFAIGAIPSNAIYTPSVGCMILIYSSIFKQTVFINSSSIFFLFTSIVNKESYIIEFESR